MKLLFRISRTHRDEKAFAIINSSHPFAILVIRIRIMSEANEILHFVYNTCRISRAESIIDIHHGDTGST